MRNPFEGGFLPLIRDCLARMGRPVDLPAMNSTLVRLRTYLWREWIRPLAVPLLLVAAAKSALADINFVPSGSMRPTLLDGDVVVVNKLAYDLRVPFTFRRLAQWSTPAPGDIVVCFEPNDGTRLVKRVVGAPGDMIELRQDRLYVNGQAQAYTPLDPKILASLEPEERDEGVFASETLGTHRRAVMALPRRPARRDFGPAVVPDGSYWVMGDNRDNSLDSRYFGFVPREQIIGRVRTVFVSADIHHWLKPRFERFCAHVD